jgi:hypothetical protein
MFTIVFAWINALTRKDGTALAASDIGSSIVSQVNADGSTTPVATLTGNGTTTTIPAPTAPGTYNYQVQNVDTNGVVGDPVAAVAPVVIADTSAPAAPTQFTATLTPVGPTAVSAAAAK